MIVENAPEGVWLMDKLPPVPVRVTDHLNGSGKLLLKSSIGGPSKPRWSWTEESYIVKLVPLKFQVKLPMRVSLTLMFAMNDVKTELPESGVDGLKAMDGAAYADADNTKASTKHKRRQKPMHRQGRESL
ncbi:MAG: hypothetical protein ACP5NX_04470 [Candidatus Bilamarchaeaceae archaeon]